MSTKKTETKEVAAEPVVETKKEAVIETVQEVNPDSVLTPSELVKKYTIKDSQGLNMWVDEDAVFNAMCLSDNDASKFLGGKNPNDYFREGKIHRTIDVKSMGDLLDEDRAEVQTLRRIAPQFPDLLMFKDRMQNLYHILIPKRLSENQLDENGEYVEKYVRKEIVPVNFNAAVSTKEFGRFPSAFEPVFFQRWFARTLVKLNKKAQENLIR